MGFAIFFLLLEMVVLVLRGAKGASCGGLWVGPCEEISGVRCVFFAFLEMSVWDGREVSF